MKKTFKKIISMACITVMMCGLATVEASALTRRLYGVKAVEFDKYQIIAADVNGDGEVTSADALLVLRLVEGLIDDLPVGSAFLY